MNTLTRTYESLGGRFVFGKPVKRWEELENLIRQGLPRKSSDALMKSFTLAAEEISAILAVDKRTIARKGAGSVWHKAQSDRLLEAARLMAEVESLFNSRDEAMRWMRTDNPDIGGRPIEHIDNAVGRQAIRDTLTRIEYGVFG